MDFGELCQPHTVDVLQRKVCNFACSYTSEISSFFPQLLRVHHLTPAILVKLVRRNEEQWWLLGTYVACTLFYTCSSFPFLHQIRSLVRAYVRVDGWVNICHKSLPCQSLSHLKKFKSSGVPSALTRSFLAFPLPFTIPLMYIISWLRATDLELKYFPWSSPLLLPWIRTWSGCLLCPHHFSFIAIWFMLNSVYVFFSTYQTINSGWVGLVFSLFFKYLCVFFFF